VAASDSAERDAWMSDKPSVDACLAANALAQLRREMFGEDAAPVRLGRYEIESRIGAGGMGTVYEALDPALGRRVAIKLLRRQGAAEDGAEAGRARLRREAMALAMLSHPNVVTIHDVGEADGALFIAMERVDGANLSAWLAEQRRDVGEILEVFTQAARGLIAAHESGLVHRDFKPANVLVGRDGRVRVADFGIAAPDVPVAAPAEPGLASTSRSLVLTQTLGSTLGTPAYMAPEQHRGAPATQRSDQYSFALTMYEALCGAPPFRAGDERELFECKITLRFAVELPAHVPDPIRAALLRALRRAPEERFDDMSALLRELSATPEPATPRRRLRSRVLLPAIVFACAAILTATLASRDDESPHALAQAFLPRDEALPLADREVVVSLPPAPPSAPTPEQAAPAEQAPRTAKAQERPRRPTGKRQRRKPDTTPTPEPSRKSELWP
jgi:serine/threonine protein kinase